MTRPEDLDLRVLELTRDQDVSDVLVATIDNPESDLNLFDFRTMEDLAALWGALRTSTDVRAVLLTARGRFFCAGGAFEVMESQKDPAKVEYLARLTRRLYGDMLDQPVPVVCAMNGPAVGAGCSAALLSDIRVGSSRVTFTDPHVERGLTAGMAAGIWTLFLGPAKVKRYLLTGEKMTAEVALREGLLDYLVPEDQVLEEGLELARRLASGPPLAMSHTKLLVNRLINETLNQTFAVGAAWQSQDFHTADHAEAIESFREKRVGVFHGR